VFQVLSQRQNSQDTIYSMKLINRLSSFLYEKRMNTHRDNGMRQRKRQNFL